MARKWHPDLHPDDPRAHERMVLINEAITVLTDDDLRDEYDRARDDGSERGPSREFDSAPTASPTSVDFGDLQPGVTSEDKLVAFFANEQPADFSPERERGSFGASGAIWRLKPAYVPRPEEKSDPTELVRFWLVATVASDCRPGLYQDSLVVQADEHRLTVPLRLRVRAASTSPHTRTPPPHRHATPGSTSSSGPAPTPSRHASGPVIPRHTHWRWSAPLAAVIVILVVSVIASNRANAPPATTTAQPGPRPTTSPSLPETARTAFEVRPSFQAAASTAQGSESTPIDHTPLFKATVQPVQKGFTLTLTVRAQYTSLGSAEDGGPLNEVFSYCVDIATPDQNGYAGDTYQEPPLRTSLTRRGSVVTGELVYAAVLPGSYSLADNCDDGGFVTLGSVTTGNLGVSGGSNGSGAVVFEERKARRDTVLVFGSIGFTQGNAPAIPSQSCISTAPAYGGSYIRPGRIRIYRRVSENGQIYVLGTVTFPVASSRIAGDGFLFDCQSGSMWVQF
jgi:curved DNA-binding protein CbpA